ncbi:Serine/threonine-protein kinase Nek4, partial [Tetrabaena socialis]
MSADNDHEARYEVREVIGKGAFGEVNLVVEKASRQRFVLKRIKMARQSEWQRKATRLEIEIVSRLRHPFVMPYKEHWTHHGHTINVVYGYCEKGDLTSAIKKQRGKPFPEETLRLWLAELLLAVDYMRRQNVLHRDLKTQNILLTGDGDVQIGDFGLSTGTLNDYSLVGTPHFMSPELLSNNKYSFETDMSLGVVMYELTSLKPPFNAFNLSGLVAKIKRAALPPIPAVYSADWSALLKSMLRKDPGRRAAALEVLALPSMQAALQTARQRAALICPDIVLPDVAVETHQTATQTATQAAAQLSEGGAAGSSSGGSSDTAPMPLPGDRTMSMTTEDSELSVPSG